VNAGRALAAPLGLIAAAGLAACVSTRPPPAEPTVIPTVPPAATPPPPDAGSDAIPRIEARARKGNPPFYDVFGKRYFVLSSSAGYWERGVASWYGPGFHKVRTSTGEPYDMYAMTAAHRTLPLPAYVRVTNLQNGRSVVVRVNDRGPFVGNRIIDLSYTAAAKLDMLRNGTALVEVRAIDASAPLPVLTASTSPPAPAGDPPAASPEPSSPAAEAPAPAVEPPAPAVEPPAPAALSAAAVLDAVVPAAEAAAAAAPSPTAPAAAASAKLMLFVQAGAFSDPANAERLAEKLRHGSYGRVFVRDDRIAGRRMYRVRIGPVPDVAEFDRVVAALEQAGISDAHLALD
jgi:rare lipoprotein A